MNSYQGYSSQGRSKVGLYPITKLKKDLYGVERAKSFFHVKRNLFIFVYNSSKWTAMIGLYYLAGLFSTATPPAYNIFAAGAVLMGIPLMALFLVSQRMMTKAYSNLAGIK
jgi:hypothetical protein